MHKKSCKVFKYFVTLHIFNTSVCYIHKLFMQRLCIVLFYKEVKGYVAAEVGVYRFYFKLGENVSYFAVKVIIYRDLDRLGAAHYHALGGVDSDFGGV